MVGEVFVMSFYHTMRTHVKVKEEYVDFVVEAIEESFFEEMVGRYPFLRNLVEEGRSNTIMEGPVISEPDHWEGDVGLRYRFDPVDRDWLIVSSANYGQELFEIFKRDVLSEICEEIYSFEVVDENGGVVIASK